MGKNRLSTWLALMVVGVALVIVVIGSIFAYIALTATPIHESAQAVPSVSMPAPSRTWAGPISQARQIARASMVEQNLPGLSIAVGAGGEIVWAEGFGWADLQNKVPVGPGTRFKIGTASTVLTSAGVGVLLEEGALRLDDPIRRYVPEFPEKKWPVTLRQVMGHLAGLRSDGGDEGPFRSTHCDRTLDGLQLVADASLRFQPGTAYRFSNYGWILVSAAIEAAARQPFFAFMQERVFEPLDMDDTIPDAVTEPVPDQAMMYFPQAGSPRYGVDGGPRRTDYSCYAGGAAFLSSPFDLVRFGLAMRGGTLLRPSTVDTLQTSQRLHSGEETGYGLGWDRETVTLAGGDTTLVGHDGLWMGGPVASLMLFPEHAIVVAVASNIAYADTFGIGVQVADAFASPGRGGGSRATPGGGS